MAKKKFTDGTLSKAATARKLGLDGSAITYAVKRGDLFQNNEGRIDPADQRNEPFFRKHKTAIKASGVGGRGKPIITEDPDEVIGNSVEQGRSLDNQLKRVKIQKARIEYLEAIKVLVPVEIVSRNISNVAALLNENFRSFDECYGAELFEVAKEGNESQFTRHLAKLINKSMEAVVSGTNRLLKEMKPEPKPEKSKEKKASSKKAKSK